MRSFIKNIFIATATLTAVFGFAFTAFAAGNMDGTLKWSQFIDMDLDTSGKKDLINWMPTNGGATITDNAITGYIWGETVGWIHMNPSQSGVKNTCTGHLSGYAWGENTGWINFDPTNATISPNINTTTGAITGQVWAQNYGWIQLASPEVGFAGLTTDWRPSTHCHDVIIDPPIEGSSPTLKVYNQVVGGTATPGDFIMYVKEGGVNAVAPFPGSSAGNTVIVNSDTAHIYVVSEQLSPDYTATFSGDCAPNGIVAFTQGDTSAKTCTIINTYKLTKTYVCKDPDATNYDSDPNALTKNSLCIYPGNYACKDPAALNYNSDPVLLSKKSLCKYPDKNYACKDPAALNYNSDPKLLEDNNLCKYKDPEYACKDITATNYDADPKLTADNSLCKYKNYACKDPSALNYNSDITMHADNTLCKYPTPPPKNPRGLLLGLALLGVASTIPGIIARVGHMLLTFVWGRKKIRGVVYDTKTEEPLDPVYVSVIDLTTNQEIKNQQTDMEGRFGFVLPKGHYKIVAGKTNYLFPSAHLAGRESDEVYDKLYFGEPFTVEDEDRVVSMNIPMDPVGTDWNQVQKHKTSFLQYLVRGQTKYAWIFNALFVIGFLASIMITYFYPTWWNYVMTGIYVILGLIQVYGYGPIYAGKITKNGMPLAGAIVRIWSASLNHEVAQRVTEVSGGYYVLVPKADYFVTIDQKNQDGTFTKLFTSSVFHARHGCIDKNFSL